MVSKQASSDFTLGNTVSMSHILQYPFPSKKRGMPHAGMYTVTVEKNVKIESSNHQYSNFLY